MKRRLYFDDLTGKKFNRLLILSRAENGSSGAVRWLCECDCGNKTIVAGGDLKRNRTKSCGCYNIEKSAIMNRSHGMHGSATYITWAGMLQRCRDKNHKNYRTYGGRGIDVCERWLNFQNFIDDMGKRPEGLTLDRIDNSLGYSPDNCRWSSQKEQTRNTKQNRNFTIDGKTQCLKDWAHEFGINYTTLQSRLKRGLSINEAVR